MKKTKLFQRDFTMVVIGQIISLFGNGILRFALPLYLLRETESSALFGMVTACSFIPMVIFSFFGGVIADRVNKRNIMVVLDFSTAGLICIFYAAFQRLPLVPLMIVVLMILYGISGAYQPAVQASIPLLAESDTLMQANAVINMVGTLSGLLGPVIGGILFGSFGIKPILALSIVCFLASAVMEIFIHIPYEKTSYSKGAVAIVKEDLKESWYFVKNEKPAFIAVVCILALFNLVLSAALIVGIPIMIIQILGMSDMHLGAAQGAMGVGGLLGGILAGAVHEKMKMKDSWILLAVCACAALLMGMTLIPGMPNQLGFWVITVMSLVIMVASTIFTVKMMTVLQQQTPPHLLGKIMAAIMAVANCAQPAGQALYGVLFDIFSEIPWVVMSGGAVVAFLISLYSKRAFQKLNND